MISPRRFNGHAAQQRMIKIGRFQPGNVCCDLEEVFENRQRPANQSRSQNSVGDSEGTLQSDHAPIIGRWIKPIDRSDQTKRQRQQPDGESDSKACADQLTATSHL